MAGDGVEALVVGEVHPGRSPIDEIPAGERQPRADTFR
jgi:hypothetical protein